MSRKIFLALSALLLAAFMNLPAIFKRQILVARVYGIPVRIDYTWFIVFAMSAATQDAVAPIHRRRRFFAILKGYMACTRCHGPRRFPIPGRYPPHRRRPRPPVRRGRGERQPGRPRVVPPSASPAADSPDRSLTRFVIARARQGGRRKAHLSARTPWRRSPRRAIRSQNRRGSRPGRRSARPRCSSAP